MGLLKEKPTKEEGPLKKTIVQLYRILTKEGWAKEEEKREGRKT